MTFVSNKIKKINAFADKYESKLVSSFFWYFLISFFIDRVVNYFCYFPFFVASAIAIFPILLLIIQYKNPEKWQLLTLLLSFIIIVIINNVAYGFHKKNISDLLFICLFIAFYYYYRNHKGALKVSFVYAFLIISLFLFSFTFLAIDSQSIFKTDLESLTKRAGSIQWDQNPRLDYVEYVRVYHNGLFRLPHVASYFFGFLSLFFIYRYWKKKKIVDIVLLAISLVICILTGARAIVAAFFISGILFLLRRKYIIYLQIIIIAALLMILRIEYFLRLTENTIFYQYFSIIQTTTENFTRLSRFRIYYSWWVEVSNFGIWDFLIGKSFINTHFANMNNLGYNIWFHNDFLNIFFTYGIWATIIYVWFFIKIYRDNKIFIKNNFFIFVFYSSMVITAFINGFYYYFPVFLLYIFWIMINEEKQLV